VSAGTLALRSTSQCGKLDGMREKYEKSESYLGVKLCHIGVCENNRLREMRCLIKRSLKDTCTVPDASGRAPVG